MKVLFSVMGTRKGIVTFNLLIGSVFTLMLAGVIYIIPADTEVSFWHCCKLIFFFFSAPIFVAAGLLVLTKMPEDWTFGFGAGLYYGTVFFSGFIDDFLARDGLLIAFVITALICYIVYEKKIGKQQADALADLEFFKKKHREAQPVMRLFEEFAQRAGMTVPEYTRYLRIQAKQAQGMSEEDAISAIEQEDNTAK